MVAMRIGRYSRIAIAVPAGGVEWTSAARRPLALFWYVSTSGYDFCRGVAEASNLTGGTGVTVVTTVTPDLRLPETPYLRRASPCGCPSAAEG